MGCGISKFNIPKGRDASHRSDDRDGFRSSREEACIDMESSGEEDLYDRDDGISYLQSPSFRVYCVPSQLDDGISEGDSTPEEIKEDKKMVVKNFKKKGLSGGFGKTKGPSRKEKKSYRSRFIRYIFHSS